LACPKVDVNMGSSSGALRYLTPLHAAIACADSDLVGLLLTNDRVLVNGPGGCQTPLQCAIVERNMDAVKLLLNDARIDVNAVDAEGVSFGLSRPLCIRRWTPRMTKVRSYFSGTEQTSICGTAT
jgi:hypothetical protein